MFELAPVARNILVEEMCDMMIVLDANNRVMDFNLAAQVLLTIDAKLAIGQPAEQVIQPWQQIFSRLEDKRARKEEIELKFDQQSCDYELTVTYLRAGSQQVLGRMLLLHDITEYRRRADEMRFLSNYDKLTGIYNWNYFETEMLRLQQTKQNPIGVIVADVDSLGKINESLGRTEGDRLLCSLADVLRKSFRLSDIVARIGGDEFAALLPGADAEMSGVILDRVVQRLEERNAEMPDLPIGLSIGIATSTEQVTLTAAFKLADKRMFERKGNNSIPLADKE
jgi:diguanylate cyclase (GGDEF)-like protein/PAS domain S-box-containing protein